LAPHEKLQLLVIGSGRLAQHLPAFFNPDKVSLRRWSRGSQREFNSVDISLDATERLREVLRGADAALLAISDDGLRGFYDSHRELWKGIAVYHCSGSQYWPDVPGVHPLMTFGTTLYSQPVYASTPLIFDCAPAREHPLWASLPNPKHLIHPQMKHLYHALCATMGNVPCFIWSEALRLGRERLDLSPDVFRAFLQQTLENTLRDGSQALTGPVARRDLGTIERHLAALSKTPLEKVYRAYVEVNLS
jgi:hypothetical protein